MSYSERDGQVILTMSREDYDALHYELLDAATTPAHKQRVCGLWDRLNSGNPNYTPYQVEDRNETDG
jgi:hypothetical protein